MAQKKNSIFADMQMDELESIDTLTGKKKKPLGRPKLNPYAQEQKITTRVPKEIHRQLRIASAMAAPSPGCAKTPAPAVSQTSSRATPSIASRVGRPQAM